MVEIVIIAAIADNGIIGAGNDIPWRIREDFQRFKRLTLGHPCVMGRATYESLPPKSRPLPGRENIVLSRNPAYHPDGIKVVPDLDAALSHVRAQQATKAFIAGGRSLYRLGLAVADTLELTRVHRSYVGDVSFPEFDSGAWERVALEHCESLDAIHNEPVSFTYETYRRRRPSAPAVS